VIKDRTKGETQLIANPSYPRIIDDRSRLSTALGNFLRTLATPEPIKDWSLTTLKDKLIKIGAKVVSHGRYVIFQMAEVAIPRQMFQEILRLTTKRSGYPRCW
jgi:hypothetical protein